MGKTKNTSKYTEQQISSMLRSTHEEAATWERESYAKSNEGLYTILARCLEIYQAVARDNALREVLYESLAQAGMKLQKGPTASKVVAAVFRNPDRRRTFVYSKVLREAERNRVTPARLPAWIKKSGGVEAIRSTASSKSNNRLTSAQAMEFAASELARRKGTLIKDRLDARFDSSVPAAPFALLIVRQTPGSKSVLVWGTAEEDDVARALAIAGRSLHAEITTEADIVERRKRQHRRDDIIAEVMATR
jgi:hypothetical protein